jgi:hypothetical protein
MIWTSIRQWIRDWRQKRKCAGCFDESAQSGSLRKESVLIDPQQSACFFPWALGGLTTNGH